MKIRLKLTTPSGQTSLFEHEGGAVRIGRDPSCELQLDGEDAGKAASRQHACIELTPTGARLIDTGSANKTLHNNQPIDRPVLLQRGDNIQIGYTGTTLVVLDIDLAPSFVAAPRRIEPRFLLAAVAGLAVCLGLLCAVLFWPRRSSSPTVPLDEHGGAQVTPDSRRPETLQGGGNRSGGEAVDGTKEEGLAGLPSFEIKTVGHYLRPSRTRSSVLLQRAGDNYPWSVLRSGQAVSTAHTLLSLPGYESLVSLDGGVRLALWGNLPVFENLPIFESVIILNPPGPGVAVDLTLDRGRVEIDAGHAATGARIRLRFLREVWDVDLGERGSRVCVELLPIRRATASGEPGRCFGLFSRGKVFIKTGRKEVAFASPARVAWSSNHPKELFEEKLPAPPPWWDKTTAANAEAKDALLSLGDWAKKLDQAPDILPTIVAEVHDSPDPTTRLLGLAFLAALEHVGSLVEFLGEKGSANADVRTVAAYALRDWLARNKQRRHTLTRLLIQQRDFTGSDAGLLASLLLPFSPEECNSPETYHKLIGHLDHKRIEIRHLAFLHLYRELAPSLPSETLKIDYDPTDEPAKRKAAVAKWQKAIPPGWLPVAPAK